MIVFYSNTIDSKSGLLANEEARHCIKVLRKKEGTPIVVMDGLGNRHNCIVTFIGRNEVTFDIVDSTYVEREVHLPTIAIGLLKNATRLEWFLEKATEIGARTIVPMITDRTENKKFKQERAQSIIVSAMKQSLRQHLPELLSPITFNEALELPILGNKFICHYDERNPHLYDIAVSSEPSFILVGPEGDFSDRELDKARDKGFRQMNISDTRLRTETAGLTVAQIISLKNRK